MNFPEIKISHVPYLLDRSGKRSASPARCNRVTGEIFINDEVWGKVNPTHRLFILLHECGHIAHNTSDEFLADQFAFEHFVKSGYPLTQSVQALSGVLTGKDQHVDRVRAQINRAYQVDKLNRMQQYAVQPAWYAANNNFESSEDLFGMVKNWKKNQEIRRRKKDAKVEIKLAKADAIRAKGEAKKILADQGIAGGGSEVLNKALDTAQALLAPKQDSQGAPMPPNNEGDSSNKTKKILMWVGGGLALLTIAALVFKLIRKK